MDFFRRDGNLHRLLILTGAVFVLMSILNPGRFLTTANFESMAFQFPELALLSFAMMVAMLTGGIDLSVVATANLSGILSALILTRTLPDGAGQLETAGCILCAIVVALTCGSVCGSINSSGTM